MLEERLPRHSPRVQVCSRDLDTRECYGRESQHIYLSILLLEGPLPWKLIMCHWWRMPRHAVTVPPEFSLELDGLREQGCVKRMNDLQGVLHGLQCIMFYGLLDSASSPPGRVCRP